LHVRPHISDLKHGVVPRWLFFVVYETGLPLSDSVGLGFTSFALINATLSVVASESALTWCRSCHVENAQIGTALGELEFRVVENAWGVWVKKFFWSCQLLFENNLLRAFMATQEHRFLLLAFESWITHLDVIFGSWSCFCEVRYGCGCAGLLNIARVVLNSETGALAVSHQVVQFSLELCFVGITATFPVLNIKFLNTCLLLSKWFNGNLLAIRQISSIEIFAWFHNGLVCAFSWYRNIIGCS
jgi:hypothetical protein